MPSILRPDISALNPAGFLKALLKRRNPNLCFPIGFWNPHQNADRPDALDLCARRERPRGGHAAKQRDELAAPHSITRSASASSWGGISSPSAFAVLKLITSSNFVGCSTGKSAGLAPFNILSTKIAAL